MAETGRNVRNPLRRLGFRLLTKLPEPTCSNHESAKDRQHSKSVCLNGHAGSNPALSAKMKRSHFCATFSFSRWVADSNLPPPRSNGYGDALRRRRVSNPRRALVRGFFHSADFSNDVTKYSLLIIFQFLGRNALYHRHQTDSQRRHLHPKSAHRCHKHASRICVQSHP